MTLEELKTAPQDVRDAFARKMLTTLYTIAAHERGLELKEIKIWRATNDSGRIKRSP